MKFSVELDCSPGNPRPGDLIEGVMEGTGLTIGDTVSRIFGNWTWIFEVESEDDWKKVQAIIKPRIVKLYERGLIRYGSW